MTAMAQEVQLDAPSTPTIGFSPKPPTAYELSTLEEGKTPESSCTLLPTTTPSLCQKMIAETVGIYFMVFAGCASVLIDAKSQNLTLVGIAVTWGLVVMVMIYTLGHISGAHFNPAVTVAFATTGRFPAREVPAYILAQVLGSILASGTLILLFNADDFKSALTCPKHNKEGLSLAWEIIITALLMFVICGVATDTRAINEFSGVAVGATILLNVLIAGSVSGASMNPARSLGPAIATEDYNHLWIYIIGPIIGAIVGAKVYSLLRLADKSEKEITKSG